jgi:tetratricopeptide (TPR) repeat protein
MQVYEEVRSREPRSPVAIAGIARSLLDQGRHAEAKQFLRTGLAQVPASPALYLMLAEAESGLGSVPEAITAIRQGVEQLPRSAELWSRLGELYIAREGWTDASSALAHAIALDPSNADLLLRAGFVAERLGHPNEALAMYEHATQVAPENKQTWTSRGLALLATGRPADAVTSFERALALDSDFEPAKDGKRLALQKTRDTQIGSVGREALLLEARLRRPVTKNDLFVTLHVPYDMLDPVLEALAETPKVELDALSDADLRDLETASYRLITAALEHRPEGVERRGLTLADVAALSPPAYTLAQIQRLFGYVKAVLEADVRAENLKLTPDIEELVRQAITTIPSEQRTLFQVVKRLRVGIFKARIVKAVESAGSAVHAPLPSLDLASLGPEFQASGVEGDAVVVSRGAVAAAVDVVPTPVASATPVVVRPMASHGAAVVPARSIPQPAANARCVGCGGIASVVHECGAPLCHSCVAQFRTCPKCRKGVTTVTPAKSHRESGHAAANAPEAAEGFTLPSTVARIRTPKAEPSTPKPSSRAPDHPRPPEHSRPPSHAHTLEHSTPAGHPKAPDHPKAADPAKSTEPAHVHERVTPTEHPHPAPHPGPPETAPRPPEHPRPASTAGSAPSSEVTNPPPAEPKPAKPVRPHDASEDEPRL